MNKLKCWQSQGERKKEIGINGKSPKILIIMSDKLHKHPKWERFKESMKKAGKWTVKNLLPVAVSIAAGGLGLPAAIGGLASELFKKLSDANLNVPMSEEMFKEKLANLCKGDGKTIEYLQKRLEQANEQMKQEDIKLVIEHVMTPVVSEMSTMLEIFREEKTDLKEILAGWLDDQAQLIQDQSQMIQNEFLLSHEQLSAIQQEMLTRFQKMDFRQTQILENINNIQSKMQFELVNLKRGLSELIQAQFGQSVQTACDLDTMFNLATVHFNQQNLASRFDQPYNPDLYVRSELFFGSITKYLSHFKNPMKKNAPIFLLLAHLGMGKTWNFAYITEHMLNERNIAIPFFINLKDGLQQQLYGIFKTKNMREIADRCQKIKSETQLPIFLILDGLDELTASDLKDVLLILKDLLIKRTDALCVALSCRIIAWVQDQQILNERIFFEEHVWPHQLCKDWQTQFGIATQISCVLGEFSDIELDRAIDRYGLKRQHFSPGLYKICHQPYILRLVSEFVGLHNVYPKPEDPQSMASLFYSDDRNTEKKTIMYRMGIHGNILSLFSLIIEAFPSANSELSDRSFQEFANNPYFRPILYSGIILKVWQRMRSVYQINPVYVPLLSLLFPHLSKLEPEERAHREQGGSTYQSNPAKFVQYFLRLANKRRDEKDFDAEFEALKEAERIVVKAFDFDLTEQFEKRMAEFETEKRIREDAVRIEDYKGTKITKREMDILTELEKEVGEIPVVSSINNETFGVMIVDNHVVGLGLFNKGLKIFPESIEQLTALKDLSLNKNQIALLPESIEQLTALYMLDLGNNNLKFLPDTIGQLTTLNKLSLHNNLLKEIPESIGQLTSLTYLYLFDNQLTSLPDTIGQLTALQILSLGINQLTSLPDTIGQLTALETVYLSRNELKTIPETIGQLTSLKELWITQNKIQSLPETIGQLTSLNELDLGYNKFTSLPKTIGHLTALQILGLSTNMLTSIPDTIGQLKGLRVLNLEYNRLTKLPETIGQLTSLTYLSLSQNMLESIPETIGQLKGLGTLDLQVNQLKSIPNTIGQLTSLLVLDLGGNQLRAIPNTIGQLTALQILRLSTNMLTSIPDTIGQLKGLRVLNLEYNRLTKLPETIGQLTSLEGLYLSQNMLESIPETIGQLTALTTLWINNNQLTALSETIGQLTALKELILNENKLTSLPETVGEMTAIEELYISRNFLREIPGTLKNLTNLKKANISESLTNDPVVEFWKNKGVEISHYMEELSRPVTKEFGFYD